MNWDVSRAKRRISIFVGILILSLIGLEKPSYALRRYGFFREEVPMYSLKANYGYNWSSFSGSSQTGLIDTSFGANNYNVSAAFMFTYGHGAHWGNEVSTGLMSMEVLGHTYTTKNQSLKEVFIWAKPEKKPWMITMFKVGYGHHEFVEFETTGVDQVLSRNASLWGPTFDVTSSFLIENMTWIDVGAAIFYPLSASIDAYPSATNQSPISWEFTGGVTMGFTSFFGIGVYGFVHNYGLKYQVNYPTNDGRSPDKVNSSTLSGQGGIINFQFSF